jgi:pyridoxamine 5'-phosphate oxidase
MNNDEQSSQIRQLRRHNLNPDPIKQFASWFNDAWAAGIKLAHAMTLATANRAGVPSARMVLLKEFDEGGFVFYTNYESQKGHELAENPVAALLFHWKELERQVRITGRVTKVSREQSAQYFHSRPRGSQLSASVSAQSRPVKNRRMLEDDVERLQARYPEGNLPLPDVWGGYSVSPEVIEFWQGQEDRLHDRFRYTCQPDGLWLVERLAP